MFTNEKQINTFKAFLDEKDTEKKSQNIVITRGLMKFRMIHYGHEFNGKIF